MKEGESNERRGRKIEWKLERINEVIRNREN
jgi:hypothetical protein